MTCPWLKSLLNGLLDFVQILFGSFLRFSGDDQPVIRPLIGREQAKSVEQIFDTFVGPDSAEKQDRLFVIPETQPPFCLGRREFRIGEGIVNRMPDHSDRLFRHVKILAKLVFHLLRVDENVVTKPVLNFERDAIEPASLSRLALLDSHCAR